MSSSLAAEAAQALPSLGPTMGAMSLALIIASILYGTTNLQAVIYFKEYPDDWWFYRLSIATLWVLDTLHIAFNMHVLYFYTISSFGNYIAILKFVWSFKLGLVIYNMIVFCVHIVYCVRLWMLGRYFHRIIPWFITVIVIGICATSIIFCREVYTISYITEINKISPTIEAGLTTTVSVDIIIAFAMSYYLLKGRTSTGSFSTNIKLVALMRLILISGLGTSALGLASLITFLVFPGTLIFMAIGIVTSKLYINSLLAMFNARERRQQKNVGTSFPSTFRAQGEENITNPIPLSDIISSVQTSDDMVFDNCKSERQYHISEAV
ncbi:uncharacterized protein EV420DRAFT_1524194 [Desarmillaria tabescens]|uniref:DUF6534 domain-containing protein n=1 Tax=Armillaria tabescens TaxID=1929756 RepID=A0AA39TPX5_ARMTA|nr:uncharacterized protein EV420DRAFT_1524194 [Desarmillaria tabescens]KAK0462358.1 hypothetical protein EV420DRAFT_1524194 [Desarmillaria tabescens]